VTEAFFLPLAGDRYEATAHTGGPWDATLQHAGPPAALLGRALERTSPREDMLISRITYEILHAVPVGEVEIATGVERPGKSVELLRASLKAGGREVVTARAWRVLRADTPAAPPAYAPPPIPPDDTPLPSRFDAPYLRAVEWRMVHGGFLDPGPAVAWTRLRIPIVPNEEPTGLQRVLAVADSGNGLSSVLDWTKSWFINPELTVHAERDPRGEWICLDAATSINPGGAGLATSTLSDEQGPVARGAQTLFVGSRR
jgi:hypothetical protein